MTDKAPATAAVDAHGVITGWSATAEAWLGYAPEQVLGQHAAAFLYRDTAETGGLPARWPQAWSGRADVRHRDGHKVPLWVQANPVQDGAGCTQWYVLAYPAGPREVQAAQTRAMVDWAFGQSEVAVALLDNQMRQLRLNGAMCRTLGLETEDAGLGLRLTDLISNPETESCVAVARLVARTGEPARWKGLGTGPGGPAPRVVEVHLSPVKDPAGQVCGVLVVSTDVTQEHLAKERLALVNEASTRIGSTLDVTRTAEELVEVTVPGFADFVMIDLLESVLRGDEPTSGPVDGTVPLRRMAFGSVLADTPEAVIKPGEVSTYPPGSPVAECLVTGRAVNYSQADKSFGWWSQRDPARAARAGRFGFHSVMAVPVSARGTTLGIAIFVRHQRPEPFEDEDLVLAEEIVGRAAVCVDNARRYSREHATALTLQRSLLQRHLPAQAAVEVATRYLPAQSGIAVGGDWFDVIRLSGSRIGLVVGDVVGHGIHAAATMGRLRTAVRTLADIDLEPAELLTRLDDVVTRLSAEEMVAPDGDETADLTATCLYAVYDPVSRVCSMARAGHPLPAIVPPGGAPRFLDIPAGAPLGLGGLPFEGAEAKLPEGSLLILYTDGLIESRQRDIDAGLTAMRAVLSEVHPQPGCVPPDRPSLEEICDDLIAALLPERAGDDAALLVARTRALAPDRIVSLDLPAEPAIVAEARGRAAVQLEAWGLDDIIFTTELIVSELVTNAIRHAQPPIQLRMILDGGLCCEVSDGSSTAPHLRRAGRYDEGGRGLLLVTQLAESWGTRHTRSGKTIWAQQSLPEHEPEAISSGTPSS